MFYSKKVVPFVLDKCVLSDNIDVANFNATTAILLRPEVRAMFTREIAALTALHDHYCESERSKKLWDCPHLVNGAGGTSLRANMMNLSFKELLSMLSDFGGIPYFIQTKQVFHVFRLMNRRTLAKGSGNSGFVNEPRFRLKKDRKGRKWRSVRLDGMASNQAEDIDENERPDFLNFSQFCEILGHFAITSFTHERAEDRIVTLWKWFDQSEGNEHLNKGKKEQGLPVRFAIRNGFYAS